MKNVVIPNIELRKTDYDNEYNLRGFYDEYQKAQEMIKETKRLYLSFVLSKLKPLNAFSNNNIDNLQLYQYAIHSNSTHIYKNGHHYFDNMNAYLAIHVFPIIQKRLHDETVADDTCPWIYPLKYTSEDEISCDCYEYEHFNSKELIDELIEKQTHTVCRRGSILCYPSLVGCRKYSDYDYKYKQDAYCKEIVKLSVFKSEQELEKSYNECHRKLYNRFQEIKNVVFEELGSTLDYVNKYTIMVDTYEVTTMISDMVRKEHTELPKSIWQKGDGILRRFSPYTGYNDYSNIYNHHYGYYLKCDFDISKFKRDDVSWSRFVTFCTYSNTQDVWNYIDKDKVDEYVKNIIGDYFIKYLACYDSSKSYDDYDNLYIVYNNEPKYVCKKNDVSDFTIDIRDNKLICIKENTTRDSKGGPSWRPVTYTTNYVKLVFDIDSNELIEYSNWNTQKDVSYK